MKKLFKRISAAVIALAVMLTSTVFDVPWEISAAAVGDLSTDGYQLDDDGKLTIANDNGMTEWKKVRGINAASVKTVDIQNSVTSIGESAFYYCESLSSIHIPESVTSIGYRAFQNCESLSSITIPNSVTSIDGAAFQNCLKFTSITIPSKVTSIENNTFNGCSRLMSITIPDGVTSIGSCAFQNCSSLMSITIPDSVTSIQGRSFDGCSSLSEIIYPSAATVAVNAIPDAATKVEYTVNNGKLNVTEITLGTDKESFTVTDAMNIGFVAEDHRSKVSQEGHTHLGGTATCAQKAKCVICDANYGSTLEHKWGEWKITTSPTTTNEGAAERTCQDCNTTETQPLPKIDLSGSGSVPEGLTIETKQPTMTEAGEIKYKEDETGNVVATVEIPALNAASGEGGTSVWTKAEVGTGTDQSKNPTPTEGGTFVYTSTDYGTIEVEVPALSDDAWVRTETAKPTISAGGEYTYASTDYGTVTVDVPKLSDTDFWTKKSTGNTEPGADTAGSYTYTSDYGEVTVDVPKLSDTTVWTKDNTKHVDPTEETEGKDVYISEYGEVTVTLQKLNHTHTLTRVPEVPATETSAGTKEHWHCADCGKNFADENGTTEMTDTELSIPVTGHKHTLTYVLEVSATETAAGVKEHWHCDGCGKNFADENGTKEVTADDLKIGKIETEVQAPVNVEIATPQETLIAAALTADEQQEIEKGTDIKIILKVENAAENVPAEDKGKVETEINGLSGYKLGQYLDVTLLKKIGEGQEQKITETSAPIRITFEIPSALRGKAAYSVIRVHNGTATVLPDLDSVSNTVTIETDKFSTYALTYQEKATPSNPSGGNPGGRPSGGSSGSSRPSTSTPTESDTSDATSSGSDTSNGNENSSGDNNSSDSNSSGAASSGNSTSSGNANPSSGDNNSDSNSSGAISSGNGTSSGNANSSSGDNNSDSNSSGAASSGNGTSSGNANSSSGDNNSDSNSSNTTSSGSSPSEGDDNPSTGIAVSLIPCTAALAAMVITTKRRRK